MRPLLCALLLVASCVEGNPGSPVDAATDAADPDAQETDAPEPDAQETDAPEPDAQETDAAVIDAAIIDDAAIDAATIDAATIDAATIDAAAIDAAAIDAALIDAAAIDAALIDAAPVDAAVIDATTDSAVDAGPDSAPTGLAYLTIDPTPAEIIVEVGMTSPVRELVIRNLGGTATGVALTTSGPGLTLVAHDCGTLGPGQSCTAFVRAEANTAGWTSAELRAVPTAGGNTAIAPIVVAAGYLISVEFGTPGGRVVSVPAGLDCTSNCSAVVPGTLITLNATATTGYLVHELKGLSGADCPGGPSATCTASVSGPATFYTSFHPPGTFVLEQAGDVFHHMIVTIGSQQFECMFVECVYQAGVGTTVTLANIAPTYLASTGFSIDPPCGPSSCSYLVTGATRVRITDSAIPPTRWGRRLPVGPVFRSVAGLAGGGALIAGREGGHTWIVRYDEDGNADTISTEDPSAGDDELTTLAADPLGGFYAVATINMPADDRWLRRYSAVGVLTWAIDLPDPTPAALAVDAVGNVYVARGASVVSYDRTGAQRWSISPTGGAQLVAVDGDTVGVAATGYIAAYDRLGNLRWEHMPQPLFGPAGISVNDAQGRVSFNMLNGQGWLAGGYADASQVTPWTGGGGGPKYNGIIVNNNLGHTTTILYRQDGFMTIIPAVEPSLYNGGHASMDDAGRTYVVGRSVAYAAVTMIVARD